MQFVWNIREKMRHGWSAESPTQRFKYCSCFFSPQVLTESFRHLYIYIYASQDVCITTSLSHDIFEQSAFTTKSMFPIGSLKVAFRCVNVGYFKKKCSVLRFQYEGLRDFIYSSWYVDYATRSTVNFFSCPNKKIKKQSNLDLKLFYIIHFMVLYT